MNFFRTVFGVCSHFQNYRAVRDAPVTTSVKFVAQLIGLLAVVLVLSAIPRVRADINEFATRRDHTRPDLAALDAKLVTPTTERHTWGDQSLRFILDPTCHAAAIDSNAAQGVLFTSSNFVYCMKHPNAPHQILRSHETSLAGFPNGQVN